MISVPGVMVVFEGIPVLTVTPPGGGVGIGIGRICGGSANNINKYNKSQHS